MKKLISAFLLALTSVALIAGNGPVITFEKDTYDFGEIDKGEKVSFEYKFTNKGDAELIISEVKPSCGCTTADMDKKNYQPGESGTIPITFDSTRFNGAINKTVTVVSNDATNPRKQIKLTGKIVQEVTINPTYLTIINVKRSEKVERSIKINTERLAKLEVTDVESNIPFLNLKTVQSDDKNVEIAVSFDGKAIPADKPTHTGFISFKTNSKSAAETKVNVYIKVANPITTTPRAVYMFASNQGKERSQDITIRSSGDEAFEITSIEDDLDHISVEKGEDNKLKVSLSDKAPTGKFNGTITIKTNLEEQPEIKIPVRGNVI